MPIEDVVFLGAGASTAEGAPLQGDLFKEYFSCETHPTYPKLKSFFKKFFGVDGRNLGSKLFPTFEEVLGILEIALNREEGFRDYDKQRIQQIRKDLIFLIAIVLKEKLRGQGEHHEQVEHHKQLVRRLKREDRLSKTGFVSLNYDILIDNALVDLHPDGYDLDYGIEFTNFKRKDDWKRPRSKKAIYLYKLHGSLNWLYCPTCISLTLTPKEKSVAQLAFEPKECDACKSGMIPIIIPPTFFKVMSNFYLQEVWHKAEDMLKQAKRIFFCGYSFPDADIHIKYLLKRVEINKGDTPQIFIINEPGTSKKIDKREEEIREKMRQEQEGRYKRFFKNSKKIDYTNKSFQDFCRDGVDNKSKRV